MAARLEQINGRLNPMNVQFLSRERADMMGKALEQRPGAKEDPLFRAQYGTELLNAGDSERAVVEFEAAQGLITRVPPADRHAFQSQLWIHRALSQLRIGEQENCIGRHSSNSCLLPFQRDAFHVLPRGSRGAIPILTEALEKEPGNLEARWLLNIAHMTLGTYPAGVEPAHRIDPAAFASEVPFRRFPNVAGLAGLDLPGLAGGVVVDDFDNDNDLDVLVSQWGVRDPMHYFENVGNGTFRERGAAAGLTGLVGGLNMVQADFDNDGFVDVLVLRGAWMKASGAYPNSLLRNRGDGTFEDVTEQAGLLSYHPTQTAAWFDYNGDGWLDLFIGNETTEGSSHRCELFRNNGNGTFTECAAETGLALRFWVKGVASDDYDNDGRPDLYVSCLGQTNVLLHNEGPDPAGGGKWRFRDVTAAAGVGGPLFSFPTWFFDYDNDGRPDIFVSGYRARTSGEIMADYLGQPSQGERARLYRNLGEGRFADVTAEMGMSRVLLTMGCNFGDLDNDGWPDFYLATGNPDIGMVTPNRMFWNEHGKRFRDVTSDGGFGHLQKGHAVAFADFDGDGDEDVYTSIGGAFTGDVARNVLFENPGVTNHWVGLKLQGTKSNRSAIGARIHVTLPAVGGEPTRSVYRTVNSGGSFGANPLRQHVGIGQAREVTLEVWWPATGKREVFEKVSADRWYGLVEGSGKLAPFDSPALRLGGSQAGSP